MPLTSIPENRSVRLREEYRLPVLFFLVNGAFASWQSFYNLHLDRIGFSSMQIGILGALFISTAALILPVWGMLADKFGNNRVLLGLTLSCCILVFLMGESSQFHWMVVLILLISLFHQPSGAVVDGMAALYVKENPRFSFGQFRLWSSVGYASFSLLLGYLARQGTSIIFKVSALLFLLLSLFNLLTWPRGRIRTNSLVRLRSFALFFQNTGMLGLLLIILFFGMAIAPLQQFINLYYSDIGATDTFIGWVFFVQALPEIPAYFVASWLVKRVGAEKVILFSIFVSALRMLFYGLITQPQVAIFFSILHCVTIAFFLVGVVEYMQTRTPGHLRSTAQSLIWASHYGVGIMLGNLSLGYFRDSIGMNGAMLVHASMAGIIFIVSLSFFWLTGRNGKQ
jgi:PPP family 3-phenylpropionic acid transporter